MQSRPTPLAGTIDVNVAGYRCHLNRFGEPATASDYPPLLLIHGAANDRDAWQQVAVGLAAAGCTLLVPDLPGHGLSGGPALRSIEALANWLPLLLDAAEVEAVVLVGHSMGSLIALDCAARQARRVRALALLGSSVPMPVADGLLNHAEAQPDRVLRTLTEYSLSKRFQLSGGAGHGIWGAGVTLAIMRRSPPGVLAIDLANCNNYRRGLEAAAQVTCPTLLLVARRDRMTPRRNLPPLQAALRHVHRAEIADCGHAMMNEQPHAVVDEILKFLAMTAASSPSSASG